ncbi:uncharacterized protein PAC_00402 [Phialocephala subalpina]|uniref:C2H2-type domain-containing protein n=1 Tax=Phialocephala subalpina TaxID=576137 RepID=A0A1L7WCV7_9HELO|nr:uncharacterized protein PAC_00402 [Phialocephala subalpina]
MLSSKVPPISGTMQGVLVAFAHTGSKSTTSFYGNDELGGLITIGRISSAYSEDDVDNLKERAEKFRDLYLQIHTEDHGCHLEGDAIPRDHFQLLAFPSNTNLMRSNAGELVALRNVLEKALREADMRKIVMVISQWDGLTSNMEPHGFLSALRSTQSLSLRLLWRRQLRRSRNAALVAARNAVLSMGAGGFNKELIGEATRANIDLGMAKKRNHTRIFDGRHAEAILKRVIDDIENVFRGRRKKVIFLPLAKEQDGCPLANHDHILPSVAAVITHVMDEMTKARAKTCLFCDKKFQAEANLKNHKANCNNPNIKLHTCHKCTPPRPFKSKGSLDRHDDRLHENPGKVEVECPDCHKMLAKETLTVHRRENCKYRKEDLTYKCPTCNLELSYKEIGKHMETAHKRAGEVRGFAEQAGMVDEGRGDAPIFAKKIEAVRIWISRWARVVEIWILRWVKGMAVHKFPALHLPLRALTLCIIEEFREDGIQVC